MCITLLAFYLQHHPDEQFTSLILQGFHVGYFFQGSEFLRFSCWLFLSRARVTITFQEPSFLISSFFNPVILKARTLGSVTHYFFKKEYQVGEASHYHAVEWMLHALAYSLFIYYRTVLEWFPRNRSKSIQNGSDTRLHCPKQIGLLLSVSYEKSYT